MQVAAHPFGVLLDEIMRDHKLNQKQLAERLRCSQGWIAHVRGGRKPPPYKMAARISRAFPEHDEMTVYNLIKDARTRLGYGPESERGYFPLAA